MLATHSANLRHEKGEVVTIVSLLSLTGASTGIVALTSQDIAVKNLRWAVDQNLKEVGNAIN